ncbi:Predicted outer membrane protein [uncultured Ruminococcus sp.]|nr:Predicted outer membrane protein [uncultured Ruminococcus sp.]
MYRKKLMRACLTGLMVVTVATANVAPVFAAEAPAEETVQEPGAGAVGADVTVKFVDERGNVIDEKNLSFDEGIYNYEMLDQYLPAGYERKSMGDFHALQGAVIEVRVMQKAPVEEVQNVKINYYDEAAGKQVAEVPVQVSIDTSYVDMAILTRYLPEGYTLEGSDCIIRDGYVYVSVAPAEEVQNVKINYYDEAAKKQVAEVPVQVSIDTSCVNMAILTRYLPKGYTIEGTDCIIRDGYVYVSVAPAEEVQNVKINYYDEDAEKQVAEVPVQVSIDTSCVNMAILTRYMPEGYALVSSDCIIRDGYVYVSVKKDVEIREAVLHITFETPNGEVVTTETVTAEGADGEDAVFRLGVDFNLPTGYKLSNDRDQVTEITIPFGSTGGHTMVVEKGDLSSIVKIQFVDAENNDEVVAGGDYFVDGDGDGIFHTREITEWVPEGYELQEVGDFQVELYKETPLQLSVTKIKEDKPETPDPEEPNKPEDPDKEDTNNKDDKKEDTKKEDKKKNSPKTGDETSAAAAALPAGVSLAAILAVLVKKFK